jgi:hypothetical protein
MSGHQKFKNALEDLQFSQFSQHPWVLETTERMAKSIRDPKRSKEQIRENCYYGSMVEFAVFSALRDAGFDVSQSNDKTYDILLKYQGREIMLDVKGLFSSTKYVTQTDWELMNADPSVVYLAFDCTSPDMVGQYLGWCYCEDMIPSNFRGAYAYVTSLEKNSTFLF